MQQRSRATNPGKAAPSRLQQWPIRLQWIPRNVGSDKFFNGDSLFLWFWASLLTVFKPSIHFCTFFTLKTRLSEAPNLSHKCPHRLNHVEEHRNLLVFVPRHYHYSFCGELFTFSYTNIGPHTLWKQIHPPLIIWAPAKLSNTGLAYTGLVTGILAG
jgi:hypothetical protein